MGIILGGLAKLQAHAGSITIGFFIVLVFLVVKPFISGTRLPKNAPELLQGRSIFDSARFSTSRAEYLRQGKAESKDGQFSFWYGPNHAVALSGQDVRSTYLTARGLDALSGFIALFGNSMNVDSLNNSYMRFFISIYKKCAQDEHLSASLRHLTTDSDACFERIGASNVINPLDVMEKLIYQLTHRVVGTHDVANDPELIENTLAVYRPLEEGSFVDVLFPFLPTPSKISKIWGFTKLHWSMQKIINKRRKSGKKGEDMMQMIIDHGCSDFLTSLAVIGSMLAGMFNTSSNTVWTLCNLAQEKSWLAKTRAQIDAVLEKRRRTKTETRLETFQRFTLDDWENELSLLHMALKESMRFIMAGTVIRKNISGKDIPLADTGLVIPKDSIAVYATADAHLDPQIYPDPMKWDPDRHSEERAEGANVPHSFIGWGSGHHTCPAMRFATMNMIVPIAMFIAYYDFEMCDQNGNNTTEPLPELQFDRVGAGRPTGKMYIRCKRRSYK
ncbi:Cytochrome P450 monooxygenase -like protein [Cladobotryum mycophilum]|uniref:Cytochrome P450 monooxygenase -like protein n=1 Tax=Cladobotryum mycophilum TaxID=491253 RepID=A0ABR0SQW9_9HYPO